MGCVGITEGAIPFAAADPVRIIPCIMFGSAVGSVIAMLGGVGDHAPHGGPIVIFVVDHKAMYVIAIAAGMLRHGPGDQRGETVHLRPAADRCARPTRGCRRRLAPLRNLMNVVAVTACPTGIAHTYMAAESLEKTGKQLGHTVKVETQGAMGIENELSPAEIKAADYIIFAVDIDVEQKERFDGRKVIQVPVALAIKDPKGVFAKMA